MTTIGRPAAIRPAIVSKPDAVLEVSVFKLSEEVKVVRYRFNFWNIIKKLCRVNR